MEVKAIGKFIKVQPRKVRIVADEIRGKEAVKSAALLRYHSSKGAYALRKVLISAMANALENHSLSPDSLRITKITVDEGPRMKRMRARAQGRGNRILKKTSHITVVVEEDASKPVNKVTGSNPKPRPTFAAPKKGKAKPTAKAAKEAEAVKEEAVEAASTEVEAKVEEAIEAVTETAKPAEVSEPAEAAKEAEEAPSEEKSEEGEGSN